MMRRLFALFCLILSIALSCNSGELDAFSTHAGASGASGASGAGGSGGSGQGGGQTGGFSGTTPGGGEGGDGSPDALPIDDFEDGDLRSLLPDAEWYVSNDATGVQSLAVAAPPVELPGSTLSAHTTGTGFESFGALLGLDIAGNAATFDASSYAALQFSARAEVGSTPSILFAFVVGSQHFAVPLTLGPNWDTHTILFTDALPVEVGPSKTFDPSQIAGIQFFVPNDASFDYWLDDLAFVR